MSTNAQKTLVRGCTVAFFFALLVFPEIAATAVATSMQAYCTRLIPILFPYMVLSHFLVPSATLGDGGKHTLWRRGGLVFCLGQICGYPMGAKLSSMAYRHGTLSPKEASILCAVASGASPAFLLYGVGAGLWHDVSFGMLLYLVQVTLGIGGMLLLGQYGVSSERNMVFENFTTIKRSSHTVSPAPSFATVFCTAIRDSSVQILTIGGTIVFFSLLSALISTLLCHLFPHAEKLTPMIASLLEFSGGTRLAAASGGYIGLFCTGFAVGFGGLSVLAQAAYMLENGAAQASSPKERISLRLYLLWRLGCGAVLGGAAMIYGYFVPTVRTIRVAVCLIQYGHMGVWLSVALFLLGILWYRARRPHAHTRDSAKNRAQN